MSHVWGRGEVYTGFWWGILSERDHLENSSANGMIILSVIFRLSEVGMIWIDLAKDRDRWRALDNAVTKFRAPLNAGNFLTS